MVIARRLAIALVLLALAACADEGVPSPATATLADGTKVWRIQRQPPCPDNAACDIGVYINRWYYSVDCEGQPLDEATLGEVFAVGDGPGLYADEARIIEGRGPETLALHLLSEPASPCSDDR